MTEWTLGLPEHLKERVRLIASKADSSAGGEFILYWMQTAVRTDENPALEVAYELSRQMQKSLLVYHALSERYAFASDRHHTFILQGARDVQLQFRQRDIDYFFHLERRNHRSPLLRDLAQRAAVVVIEDMPTFPPRHFLRALRRSVHVPFLAVDTACIVPMQSIGRPYVRAFEFREATRSMYSERVPRAWPSFHWTGGCSDRVALPCETLDLSTCSLADLVAECDIDHTIGPVYDTVGGSQAGYDRWNRFLKHGLSKYAHARNDPLVEGTSRMSAYLHYGMVSPFRLAREAAHHASSGAEKYLDELLIWRELAYVFCRFRSDHDSWSALPDWAQKSLAKHVADARSKVYSWYQLARGETDDRLWNAAQKSLLLHGELHNNVRMTWGKALLHWTRSPKEALDLLIDLNHRYALDGRDPASYGGILWCFGLFDRPFSPEQPILGVVRPRSTQEHAARLRVEKYSQRVSRLRVRQLPRVAVVGAGLSGAIVARILSDQGLEVTVFEKSRGVGGRMATRRNDHGSFDHGAQYFTARDPRFRQYVKSWKEQQLVAKWEGPIAVYDSPGQCRWASSIDRFVGVPGMNAIARQLLSGIDVRQEIPIASIQKTKDQWELGRDDGSRCDRFDRIVLTAPAAQSAIIVRDIPEMARQLESVDTAPCWCVMLTFSEPMVESWVGAFINVGPIRWIARNSTKPGRGPEQNVVIHASPEWSKENLECEPTDICDLLYHELEKVLALSLPTPLFAEAHRWRYSIPTKILPDRYVSNLDQTVFACGDWAGGPKVEGAFLSGSAVVGRILSQMEFGDRSIRQKSLFDDDI